MLADVLLILLIFEVCKLIYASGRKRMLYISDLEILQVKFPLIVSFLLSLN